MRTKMLSAHAANVGPAPTCCRMTATSYPAQRGSSSICTLNRVTKSFPSTGRPKRHFILQVRSANCRAMRVIFMMVDMFDFRCECSGRASSPATNRGIARGVASIRSSGAEQGRRRASPHHPCLNASSFLIWSIIKVAMSIPCRAAYHFVVTMCRVGRGPIWCWRTKARSTSRSSCGLLQAASQRHGSPSRRLNVRDRRLVTPFSPPQELAARAGGGGVHARHVGYA